MARSMKSEAEQVVMSSSIQNGTIPGRKKRARAPKETFEQPPLGKAIWTYISYGLLIILGHIHDLLRKLGLKQSSIPKNVSDAF